MCARMSHGGQCPPYSYVGASLLATGLKARSCVAAGRLQAGSYREGATCRGVGDIFRHVTPYLVHQARLRKMSLTPCALARLAARVRLARLIARMRLARMSRALGLAASFVGCQGHVSGPGE